MLLTNLPQHHSAEVHLFLETPHGTYPLAQIAPNDVIFAKPVNIPPCDAEIVMQVDGTERRWPVRLLDGVTSADRRCDTTPR
ncbi:MAG: hypothetical protein JWM11_6042 [Planctomycetaceae bacterium]|nr:hypothetical protein [Planctomycetaceae bacterium]